MVQAHLHIAEKTPTDPHRWGDDPLERAAADDAKDLLTKIGSETSLRYAIHLITAASLVATKRKAAAVDVEDIGRAYTLFVDVKRSAQFLMEYQEQYMFNEVPDIEREDVNGEAAAMEQ
jgi:RuvB-like protein 2